MSLEERLMGHRRYTEEFKSEAVRQVIEKREDPHTSTYYYGLSDGWSKCIRLYELRIASLSSDQRP
jgi:hypothetical protein